MPPFMSVAVSPIIYLQSQIAASLRQVCANEPVAASSGELPQAFPRLSVELKGVTSNYLPSFQSSLSILSAREPLVPAVRASLILSLATYWNALSCLRGASSSLPISESALASGLKAAGLGSSAEPIASSVFAQKPTPIAMRVMTGRPLAAKWFRDTLEASALWRSGVKGRVAPMLAEQVMHLERTSETDYREAIATTRPFQLFADAVKGVRDPILLPEGLRRFLLSERFTSLALQRNVRKRRTLIAFLGLAALTPSKIPGANFARFPDFESFQSDKGVWPARNNFHLYFVAGAENVYRTNPVLKRFRKAYPDLDRSLVDFFRRSGWDGDKTIERLLYEAYRRMASLPQYPEKSLVS